MAESAGSLLLRAGVVRPEQVAAAHDLRQREGGSFGECLIRIGAIDEEGLVEFYHKRLMVPRLEADDLEQVPREVLGLIPADMAAEFRILPVDLDNEGTVTLAMADPSDNHAVDEAAFFADRFVVRAVAGEAALRRALERHYGLRLAPPITHAPLARSSSGTLDTEVPRPPRQRVVTRPFVTSTPQQVDEQVVLLTRVKHADATPLPMPVPPPEDYQAAYAGELTPDAPPVADGSDEQPILLTKAMSVPQAPAEPAPRRERDTLPGFPAIVVPEPPLLALRAAQNRDAIATAVLDYVAQLAGRVLFFVVRKTMLVGHDARGQLVDPGAVRQIAINLEAPSLFRDIVASRLPYRGPLPETAANRAFALAIGGIETDVLLMPISIRDRVIALLFADHTMSPLPDAALHATTREAGRAYARLIIEGKSR